MHGHENMIIERGERQRFVYRPSTRKDERITEIVNILKCECGLELMVSTEPIRNVVPSSITEYREHIAEQMILAECAKATVTPVGAQASRNRRMRVKECNEHERDMRRRVKKGDTLRYVGIDPGWEGMIVKVVGFDMGHSKIRVELVKGLRGRDVFRPDWMWFGDVDIVEQAAPVGS